MSYPEIIENFYGVYLLYNINPKYKGRTYIGYTRDPNRRIMQHNRGTWAGGAHRTNNKGPWYDILHRVHWKMVLIVHGFPNNISGLRFEWAWQNPNKTTRLQHLDLKKIPRKETEFQFKLRVLLEMLQVGPWYRLDLSIRWLEQEYYEEFPPQKLPPTHMTICYGPIKVRNTKMTTKCSPIQCELCSNDIIDKKLKCLNKKCNLVAHIACLADLFLEPGEYIPIKGTCPLCSMVMKWGDLIRKMQGCDEKCIDEENSDDEKCVGEKNGDDDEVICTQDRVFVDNNSWFLDCNDL